MAHATPSQPLRHLDGAGIGLSEPAIGRQPAVSGVERDRDPVTPARDGADDQLRIAEGDGAENRPVDAGAECVFEIGQLAEPAAELDRDVDRGADLRHGLALIGLPSTAPSRSTTWSHSAPASTQRRAANEGSLS